MGGRSASKVTPLGNSAKFNNFFLFNITERLKYLIGTEVLLGINRVYLLDCGAVTFWLSQLSTPFLFVLTIYLVAFGSSHVAQYTVCRNTYCTELLLLSISGSYFQRKKLNSFFVKLNEFDRKLNLESKSISPQRRQSILWILAIITTAVIENMYVIKYMNTDEYYGWDVVNLGIFIHEVEILFFCTLLNTVLVRIGILRRHIAKAFDAEETETIVMSRDNRIDVVSVDKLKLDLNALQDAYELLQKTSEDLKASMSFPMVVMLFSSGINTIMFLNYVFNENTAKTDMLFNLYTVAQCIKLTVLMIVPCYIANSTALHVTVIRTILHDAVYCEDLGKMKRRKIKAFYQLTEDNDITYVLWGLIKLDMYLPLSYSSLCTTYLVIVLQYSKFIV